MRPLLPTTCLSAPDAGAPSDVLALLHDEQRQIAALLRRYRLCQTDDRNAQVCAQACARLIVHLWISDRLLLPFARRLLGHEVWFDDADLAHFLIRGMVAQLHADDLRVRHRDALFAMLTDYTLVQFAEASRMLFAPLLRLAPDVRALARDIDAERLRLQPCFGPGLRPLPDGERAAHSRTPSAAGPPLPPP